MGLNFDYGAFFDELKATKPPYKCPFKNCEKVYKTFTGIQYHVLTTHKGPGSGKSDNLKPARWHHRQLRCPITPPKSVSSSTAEGGGSADEEEGCAEGMLEVEIGESRFMLDEDEAIEVEVLGDDSSQNSGETVDPVRCTLALSSQNNLSLCSADRAESILKEEPKKPLPVPVFSCHDEEASNLLEENGFSMPEHEYLSSRDAKNGGENEEDDGGAPGDLDYCLDEEDKSWLSNNFGDSSAAGMTEENFERAMDLLERESKLVTRCEMRPNSSGARGGAEDENAVCGVCGDGTCHASNAILFCDMCDMAVHQECYGVPYVPEGQWLCRRCLHSPSKSVQCCLCPCPGGPLKQTSDGRWAHVLCSAWVPEINFANPVFLEPIEGLENVPPARWRLVCFLCRRRKAGACIQCHRPNCYTAFHVSCALFAGLHIEMTQRGGGAPSAESSQKNGAIFVANHASGTVRKAAYCDLHTPKSRPNCKEGDSDVEVDEVGSRKLLAGDDEGDDDYEPGKAKNDAVVKSRTVMTRTVTSRMKRVVTVLSFPTVSEEGMLKVADILGTDVEDDAVKSLKNYWLLKRLSRNGVPLIRGMQPQLAPKSQNVAQENGDPSERNEENVGDDDNDDDDDIGDVDRDRKLKAKRKKSRRKSCSENEDTLLLSMTCTGDEETDGREDDVAAVCGKITKDDRSKTGIDDTLADEDEAEINVTSLSDNTDKPGSEEFRDVSAKKRKMAFQDAPNKRRKTARTDESFNNSARKNRKQRSNAASSSSAGRLRFYADSNAACDDAMPSDSPDDPDLSSEVKRSQRHRKMSSALFDYTYFGSVKKRRSRDESKVGPERFGVSVCRKSSEMPDSFFSTEVGKVDDSQLRRKGRRGKDLTADGNERPGKRSRRGERREGDDDGDCLVGAKNLKNDLSKVKQILELVKKREECKLEQVMAKTHMFSVSLDPLNSVLIGALDQIAEKDNHKFFAEPVDVEEVSDYLDFISRPMDLGTMRSKVERCEYADVSEFESDFDLVVDNCLTYNAKGTVYYNAAVRLRNQGRVVLNEAKKIENDLVSLCASIHGGRGGGDSSASEKRAVGDDVRQVEEVCDELVLREKKNHGGNDLLSVTERIEATKKKLESAVGFAKESYARQLKNLGRKMAAMKRHGTRKNTVVDVATDDLETTSNSAPRPTSTTLNLRSRASVAGSPSSTSSSTGPPSLLPQDAVAASTSDRAAPSTPPPPFLTSADTATTSLGGNSNRLQLLEEEAHETDGSVQHNLPPILEALVDYGGDGDGVSRVKKNVDNVDRMDVEEFSTAASNPADRSSPPRFPIKVDDDNSLKLELRPLLNNGKQLNSCKFKLVVDFRQLPVAKVNGKDVRCGGNGKDSDRNVTDRTESSCGSLPELTDFVAESGTNSGDRNGCSSAIGCEI